MSRLATIKEFAEELNVSSGTVRGWVCQQIIPAIRVGRVIRIYRDEAEKVLRKPQENKNSSERT